MGKVTQGLIYIGEQKPVILFRAMHTVTWILQPISKMWAQHGACCSSQSFLFLTQHRESSVIVGDPFFPLFFLLRSIVFGLPKLVIAMHIFKAHCCFFFFISIQSPILFVLTVSIKKYIYTCWSCYKSSELLLQQPFSIFLTRRNLLKLFSGLRLYSH